MIIGSPPESMIGTEASPAPVPRRPWGLPVVPHPLWAGRLTDRIDGRGLRDDDSRAIALRHV
jgi:hypothetical protein